MAKLHQYNRLDLCEGFTLIEVIIYCAIFITFALVAIETMISFDNKLTIQANLAKTRNNNIYKIYFANIYKRYKIYNQKIETQFRELTASTSQVLPSLKEDRDLGIILDQTSVQKEKEDYKITVFDSIGF